MDTTGQKETPRERLLTVRDVARMLSLSEQGVYLKVGTGEIPARKLGRAIRFVPQEIHDYLESCRTRPAHMKIAV